MIRTKRSKLTRGVTFRTTRQNHIQNHNKRNQRSEPKDQNYSQSITTRIIKNHKRIIKESWSKSQEIKANSYEKEKREDINFISKKQKTIKTNNRLPQ